MTFTDFLKNNRVYLDGGTGTLLQAAGLTPGEAPEKWNITHSGEIIKIHKAYYDAGSNVVATNTFGVNSFKYSPKEIEEFVTAALENAFAARNQSAGKQEKFVALDIGPTGKLLAPLGDCDFEAAVSSFAQVVKIGEKNGADLILIETMNDCLETKAALLAAKENSSLPVIVSNAYGDDARLMSGASPDIRVAMHESMGADAIGVNCSLGPKALAPIVEKYLELSSIPVICKPNAGLPRIENEKTVFDVSSKDFADEMKALVQKGVRVIGGCCGTTPEYISALINAVKDIKISPILQKENTVVTSATKAVYFSDIPVLIGERLNPTGKKRLKEALINEDINYILNEALQQQKLKADILDVNVGAPEIDEKEILPKITYELQTVCDLPLQLDSADAKAMENALRKYNGKALINSVNGKFDSMHTVFPLVKKYGGSVIALTLDENGIPDTAEERVAIAEKILKTAKSYGIDKKDIIFDPLTMTVSTDKNAVNTTLQALSAIRFKLGCHTSLGVSNVSFGLPGRANINAAFFTMALENGLSAAIINPYSAEMMTAYYAWCALKGKDENCLDYIKFAELNTGNAKTVNANASENISVSNLKSAIANGLKDLAAQKTKELLQNQKPLDIVQGEIIPALNIVGEDFENKKIFLPQLLMSAEAAGSAFDEIKSVMQNGNDKSGGMKIVIATVKGDIHDIGKNIVKLLLENYGFNVIDLGKDVPPEKIVEQTLEFNAPLVGLSALMTTTVPAMEQTVKLLKEKAPFCKTVVGGAVLTKDYAAKMGADMYAKDAMETVRYAQELSKIQ